MQKNVLLIGDICWFTLHKIILLCYRYLKNFGFIFFYLKYFLNIFSRGYAAGINSREGRSAQQRTNLAASTSLLKRLAGVKYLWLQVSQMV